AAGPRPSSERLERARRAFTRLLGEEAVSAPAGPAPRPVTLLPRSEEEIRVALRVASEAGWRLAPVGAATWLGGGGVLAPDALLSVAVLDRIVQYEPADLTLTAEAGASLHALASTTAAEGQWLALDPPGSPRGTLGATLATASAGGLAAHYGA